MKTAIIPRGLAVALLFVLAGCASYVRRQIYHPEPLANTPIDFGDDAPRRPLSRPQMGGRWKAITGHRLPGGEE